MVFMIHLGGSPLIKSRPPDRGQAKKELAFRYVTLKYEGKLPKGVEDLMASIRKKQRFGTGREEKQKLRTLIDEAWAKVHKKR